MRRRRVDIQEVALYTLGIHRLCSTSRNDEILLGRQSLLYSLVDVASAVIIFSGNVDTSIDEVVPTEDLFSPEFEGRKQMKIAAISESKLVLTVEEEPFNRFVVVPDVWVRDERIDSVHLHGDLPVNRDVALDYCLTELTVVLGSRRIR